MFKIAPDTHHIAARAVALLRDVGAEDEIVAAHDALAAEQDGLLSATLDQARRQHGATAGLATSTADTADTADQTAVAIGRVGANAVAARMLARRIATLARAPAAPVPV